MNLQKWKITKQLYYLPSGHNSPSENQDLMKTNLKMRKQSHLRRNYMELCRLQDLFIDCPNEEIAKKQKVENKPKPL